MEVVKTVDTPEDLHRLARNIFQELQPADKTATVFALSGPLGVGKTVFVRGFLRSGGINEPVTSPTYTIESVYKLPQSDFDQAIHVDAYRLESTDELYTLNFTERLNTSGNIIFVEWADKVEEALPADTLFIEMDFTQNDSRIITLSNASTRLQKALSTA